MQKIVLDTNVLISGIIAHGYSAAILNADRSGDLQLITSAHLLDEFSDVISRRHIARKYPLAASQAETLLDYFRAFATITPGIPDPVQISTDRDDDYVLACALDQQAKIIVSGDPHLLELKSYQGIPSLHPENLWKTISNNPSI